MSSPDAGIVFSFGSFELDRGGEALRCHGEPVTLTSRALHTLILLVTHRDRIVEKEEILAQVWPDSFVSDDSLTQAISMLRKTLGDDPANPTYIATVPRRGYRFVAAVSVIGIERVGAADVPTAAVAANDSVTDADLSVVEVAETEADTAASDLIDHPSAYEMPTHTLPTPRRWTELVLGAAAVGLAILLVTTVLLRSRDTPPGVPMQFVQTAPRSTTFASGASVSPDGRFIAYVAQHQETGIIQLYLRPLDEPVATPIQGTESAFRPFWSPESNAIAFFADGKLKRVEVNGAAPETITAVGYHPAGGSWSSRGVIIYADRASQLFSVPDTGGSPTPATTLDVTTKEVGHSSPFFLPDGEHFLFVARRADGQRTGFVGTLGSQSRVQVLDEQVEQLVFAAPDHLLFVQGNVLFAQRFSTRTLRVAGTPMIVRARAESDRLGTISASANGLLTFGGELPESHLLWVARDGRQLGRISGPANMHNPVLSRDGRSLLAAAPTGIWWIDLERDAPTRLMAGGGSPTWSPDDSTVAFTAQRDGKTAIFMRAMASPNDGVPLTPGGEMKISGNWSSDSQFVYASSNPATRMDVWMVSTDRVPRPLLKTNSNELHPQLSPDGRWIAYTSDESGTWEVYLQSFPQPGLKRTISIGGGAQPQWRQDGRELYYVSTKGMLMAVDVQLGATVTTGRPQPLFRVSVNGDLVTHRNQYAATSDGTRFIVDSAAEREPVNVVVNWNALVVNP